MADGPYTVLVVEDEPWIRLALIDHLEECGFIVMEAASAQAAKEILTGRRDVDLVFTDLRLPAEDDGAELAHWIVDNRPGIAVVLTSGELGQMKGLAELYRAQGITSFGKPYIHAEVSTRIRELIEAKRCGEAPGSIL